ncbi:MAG: glycosyltransferase family 39 protein [Acidobacteriota bacterium]|nr:glycosyltransferase family 39 protein [Acidobacteriota bacterium]
MQIDMKAGFIKWLIENVVARRPGADGARATVLLIVISTALRLVLAACVPPLGDEAYHWHLGTRFHLSYDHPPLTYWLAAIGYHLAPGGNFLFPRLPFVLMFGGSTWLVFLVTRLAFGDRAGFRAALLFSSAPFFLVGAGVAALPEGPLTFSWLLCLWALIRIFFDPEPTRPMLRWLGLGLALGLAFLSKYHAVFIPLGVGLFVMAAPAARRRVSGAGLLLALAAAAVVSLPIIVWNCEHGGMSFATFLRRGLTVRGVHPEDAVKNVAGQALFLMPWIWAFLVGCLAWGLAPCRRPPAARFLSLMAVGPLALFTAASAVNGEWYQFHWPLVGYVSLFPLAGAVLADEGERIAVWSRRFAVFCATAMVAVAGGILLYAATPWSGALSARVPILAPSRFVARNYDLSGFAGLAEALRRRDLLARPNLFVCAGNYMDSGRLAWVLRGRLPVLCVARWEEAKGYVFLTEASGWRGADALLVSRDLDVASDLALARPFFSGVTSAGSVTVGRGAHQTTLHLNLLEGMSRPLPSSAAAARPTRDLPYQSLSGNPVWP